LIPVSVVTGFLGSGKTTLISRLLRDPAFGQTAVIVNEFGEIGLDHELIASSDDTVLELTTGCLCCAVQTDLARTLLGLLARRDAGTADYDRVLIETSGLADPAPILQALMIDGQLSATHEVVSVVTLVDVTHGEANLLAHPEARRQVALADRLLLSKTDVAEASEPLMKQLVTLNPSASLLTTIDVAAGSWFAGGPVELSDRLRTLPDVAGPFDCGLAGHSPDIQTFVLTREAPIPALALTLLLQVLAEHCSLRLLRVKGLAAIEEMPGQPAVVQGVRHVFGAPVFLDRWPSGDLRTRLVFITLGMPRYFPSRVLDAIEHEVREETTSLKDSAFRQNGK
jgi:G3E family GTPase